MSEKTLDKVTLIVLKHTRQVMAVATRQAVPATAIPLGDQPDQLAVNAAEELKVLVGDFLVVRDIFGPTSSSSTVTPAPLETVTFSDLDVITIDLNPAVFSLKEAREFVIDKDKKLARAKDPASISFTATVNLITVTLTPPPEKYTEVSVWIYRDDRSKPPELVEGTIKPPASTINPPPASASVDMSGQLTNVADYHFLILVQGFKPKFHSEAPPSH